MIKFAIKSLVVLVLVGHTIKLVEPAESATAEPGFMPAAYAQGPADPRPDMSPNLSTFTNAQIVISHAARDVSGFCEREPLACQSGRELAARLASGIRDIAAGVAQWAREDEGRNDVIVEGGEEGEYRPLADYRGEYPILPEAPPARGSTF